MIASLRKWDLETVPRVHRWVAISTEVQDRIRRRYGKESELLFPPGNDAFYTPDPAVKREDFYLYVGGLVPYKRVDLAIGACRALGRRLVVIGSGSHEKSIRALGHAEFLGWQSDEVIRDHYRRCRALLFPGEEDFGILPVEAMAAGCPVIAFGRGGALETVGRGADPAALARVAAGGEAVVPGGVLFGEQSAEGLVRAIRLFETRRFDPAALGAQAAPFAPSRFDREFRAAFEDAYARWRAGRPGADPR
jgi:glycosyltransferase involved in cell wall biosynthesis